MPTTPPTPPSPAPGNQPAKPGADAGATRVRAPAAAPSIASPSQTVTLSALAAGLRPGDELTGTVSAPDADGVRILRTPEGTFALTTRARLPADATVTVRIESVGESATGGIVEVDGKERSPAPKAELTPLAPSAAAAAGTAGATLEVGARLEAVVLAPPPSEPGDGALLRPLPFESGARLEVRIAALAVPAGGGAAAPAESGAPAQAVEQPLRATGVVVSSGDGPLVIETSAGTVALTAAPELREGTIVAVEIAARPDAADEAPAPATHRAGSGQPLSGIAIGTLTATVEGGTDSGAPRAILAGTAVVVRVVAAAVPQPAAPVAAPPANTPPPATLSGKVTFASPSSPALIETAGGTLALAPGTSVTAGAAVVLEVSLPGPGAPPPLDAAAAVAVTSLTLPPAPGAAAMRTVPTGTALGVRVLERLPRGTPVALRVVEAAPSSAPRESSAEPVPIPPPVRATGIVVASETGSGPVVLQTASGTLVLAALPGVATGSRVSVEAVVAGTASPPSTDSVPAVTVTALGPAPGTAAQPPVPAGTAVAVRIVEIAPQEAPALSAGPATVPPKPAAAAHVVAVAAGSDAGGRMLLQTGTGTLAVVPQAAIPAGAVVAIEARIDARSDSAPAASAAVEPQPMLQIGDRLTAVAVQPAAGAPPAAAGVALAVGTPIAVRVVSIAPPHGSPASGPATAAPFAAQTIAAATMPISGTVAESPLYGPLRIETPVGTLALPVASDLPPGTRVALEPVTHAPRAQRGATQVQAREARPGDRIAALVVERSESAPPSADGWDGREPGQVLRQRDEDALLRRGLEWRRVGLLRAAAATVRARAQRRRVRLRRLVARPRAAARL